VNVFSVHFHVFSPLFGVRSSLSNQQVYIWSSLAPPLAQHPRQPPSFPNDSGGTAYTAATHTTAMTALF